MKNSINRLFSCLNVRVGLLSVVAGAAVLAFLPVSGLFFAGADHNCANPPEVATLNPYPVTFSGEHCKDYPAISGRNLNGSYPSNFNELNQGVTAQAGDEVYVRLYIHNGAAENLDENNTTARNVRVYTAVNESTGSTHTISTTFSADNTNTINGNMNIHTGPNDRLVIVPGSGELYDYQANVIRSGFDVANTTVDLGDMRACFQYSQFIRFKVRVEGPADTIVPTGQIRQEGNLIANTTACIFTARVRWTTENVTTTEITVRNPDTGNESVFASGPNGVQDAPWLQPNKTYRFTLWNTSDGQRTKLDEVWISAGDLDCSNPTPTPILAFPACDFAWSNPTNSQGLGLRKIGDPSNVQMTLSNFTPNSTVIIRNTNLSDGTSRSVAVVTDANGNFSKYDNTSILASQYSPGTYNTEAVTGNVSRGCKGFIIEGVSIPTLICSPTTQTINVNQTASFSASGGVGTLTWSAVGGNPSSGNGSSFSTSYSTQGTKSVTVSTATQSANCAVTVNPTTSVLPPTVDLKINGLDTSVTINSGSTANLTWVSANATTCSAVASPASATWVGNKALNNTSGESTGALFQFTTFTITCSNAVGSANDTVSALITSDGGGTALTCSPVFQRANINEVITFTAAGGTAPYTWTTNPSGVPATGSGATFNTRFTSDGFKVATVSSSDGQNVGCTINVRSGDSSGSPTISINKVVRNVSTGSGESDFVTARPNDTIEFVVTLNTAGGVSTNDIRVFDTLPGGFRYISGSTTLDGSNTSDINNNNGISVGSLGSGRNVVIRFRAYVENDSYFGFGTTTLTNTARVTSSAGTATDTARVDISRTQSVADSLLSIRKLGSNITKGENGEFTAVTAAPGDTLQIVIRVRGNSTTRANNVIVHDILPANLTYITRTTSIDGFITSDGLVTGNGLNLGSLDLNQEKVIKFNVQVAGSGSFSLGTTTLTNTAQARADNVPTISAQLPVTVTKGKVAGVSTVGQIPTGGETIIISALVSALLAWLMVWYGKTYFAQKRQALAVVSRHAGNKSKFNFAN